MRNEPNLKAERYRIDGPPNVNAGIFRIQSPAAPTMLTVIISCGAGWDHVSVSLGHRTPTWEELLHVKELFFRDDEWVIQFMPPRSENINIHKHTLHLWRPQTNEEIAAIRANWEAQEEWPWPDLQSPGTFPIPDRDLV